LNSGRVSINHLSGGIMTESSISETNKPIKPCKNCGSLDKNKAGNCKLCAKQSNAKYILKLDKSRICEKCGNADRNNEGRCRYCRALYNKDRMAKIDKSIPCEKCGVVDRYDSGECRPCAIIRANERYKENPKKVRESNDKWAKKNPDKVKLSKKMSKQTRRAQKSKSVGTLSKDLLPKLMVLQKGRCAICHKDLRKLEKRKIHLDHIMPLALGGANEDYNIQLLCQVCNNKKHAKDPIAYMQSLGKLL